MKRLVVALLLAAGATAGAAEPLREHELWVHGDIVIGPRGEVRGYTVEPGLKPVLEKLVADNVARWRFEPVLVEGEPVTAKTRMTITLAAREQADGDVELRVDDVAFGTLKQPRKWRPPVPPTSAMREGIDARVIVVAQLDAAGNVRKAHAVQTSLSKDLEHPRHMRKAYGEAMVASVKRWKYEPVETLADRPRGGLVTIPIVIDVGRRASAKTVGRPQWRSFIPGPVEPPPWMSETQALAAVQDAAGREGAAEASDSSFRLQTEVIGKAF